MEAKWRQNAGSTYHPGLLWRLIRYAIDRGGEGMAGWAERQVVARADLEFATAVCRAPSPS